MDVTPDVTTISLSWGQSALASLLERNGNSSCLLAGSHKKSAQFAGIMFFSATFLLTPFPRYSLADSLMLIGMYVSHTTSTLLEFCCCFMMCGIKTQSAYSLNVTTSVVERRCTTAAPSRIFTSKQLGGFVSYSARMLSRSDLFHKHNFPSSDSEGGK